jgi:TM2 domain-containing membrane protein YozV
MATQYVTCPNCKTQNLGPGGRCTNCGTNLPINPMPMQPYPQQGAKLPGAEKKLAAGLCGILVGGLGIHKFILGYQQEGLIYIGMFVAAFIIAIITCGLGAFLLAVPGIMGLVEGIIYLTKSDEEFVQTYIVNKKPWF